MSLLTNIIYYIVPFIVLLGILVFVHEFGHFIVARLLGVKVVAFSIGFGKKIWSRTDKKGTCWQLAVVPLGGYCQFLGDGDASSSTVDNNLNNLSEEEKAVAFSTQPTWKKILIVVAGPLFNYLLAIILFFGIFWMYGKPLYPAVVGEVVENSAAQRAGILAHDRIIKVNDVDITDFTVLSAEIQMSQTDPVKIEIERPYIVKLQPEICISCGQKSDKKIIGISGRKSTAKRKAEDGSFEEYTVVLPIIDKILADSPAQKAGLQTGDIIKKVDGQTINFFKDLQQYVATHQNQEIEIEYARQITVEAYLGAPVKENDALPSRRMLGVKSIPELTTAESYGVAEAAVAGVKEAYDITALTLRGVWQMITGQRGGEDVGGIIRIAELSGDVSKTGGLLGFFYFMALISVNLGLINLFPIPVLDGGNLVIFLIELLIGRELKPNVKDYIFKFGLLIVLALMVYATWNDIVHLIGRIFD